MLAEFLKNPERCRLIYLLNIVPKEKPEPLEAGAAFHDALECYWQKRSLKAARIAIEKRYKAEYVGRAMRMVDCLLAWRAGSHLKKERGETGFTVSLGKHTLAGEFDEVLLEGGELILGEIKHKKQLKSDLEYEWKHASQLSTYLVGAQAKGIYTHRAVITTVIETPTMRCVETRAERTDEQLEDFRRSVEMVADTMEMYLNEYGTKKPWPHSMAGYPCWMKGRCEYELICNRRKIDQKVLKEYYMVRQEHLAILKGKARFKS